MSLMHNLDHQGAALLWSPMDADPEIGFREYLERACHSIYIQVRGILENEGSLREFPKTNLTRTFLCDVLSLLVACFPKQMLQEEKAVSLVFGKHYLDYVTKTVPTSSAKHECLSPDPSRILVSITKLSKEFSQPSSENFSCSEDLIRIVKFVVKVMETSRLPVPNGLSKVVRDLSSRSGSSSSFKRSNSFLRKVGFFEKLESGPKLGVVNKSEILKSDCDDMRDCNSTSSDARMSSDFRASSAGNSTSGDTRNNAYNSQAGAIQQSPILADSKDVGSANSPLETPTKNTIANGLSLLKSKLSKKTKLSPARDAPPARCKSMRETSRVPYTTLHSPHKQSGAAPHFSRRMSCGAPKMPNNIPEMPHNVPQKNNFPEMPRNTPEVSRELSHNTLCGSDGENAGVSRRSAWFKGVSFKNLLQRKMSHIKVPYSEECSRTLNGDIFLCDVSAESRPGCGISGFFRKFKRSSIIGIRPGSVNPEGVVLCEEPVKELNVYSQENYVHKSDELPKLFVSDKKHMKKTYMEVFKIHNKSSASDAKPPFVPSSAICLCSLKGDINELAPDFLKKKLNFDSAKMKAKHLITEKMKQVTKRIDLAEQALLSFESFRSKIDQVHSVLPDPCSLQKDKARKTFSERSNSVNAIRRTSVDASAQKPLNRFLSIRAMPAVSIHMCSKNVQNAWRVALAKNAVNFSKKRLEMAKLFANIESENLKLLVSFYRKIFIPLLSSKADKTLADLQYALYHLDDIMLISTRVLQKLIWIISKWSLNSDICQVYYVLSKNIFPYIYLSANSVISSYLWEKVSSCDSIAQNSSIANSVFELPYKCLNNYALILKALNDYSEYGNTVKICKERFRTILNLSKSLKRGSLTILYLDSIVPPGARGEVGLFRSFLIHTCCVSTFSGALDLGSEELDLKKALHDRCFVLTSSVILLATKLSGGGSFGDFGNKNADIAPDTLAPKTLSYSWHAKLENILEASHFVKNNKYFMSFTYCTCENKETSNTVMFSREEDRNIVYRFFSESYPHVIVKKLVISPDESIS